MEKSMKSNYKTLNILLTICLVLFIIPWVAIPFKLIPVSDVLSMPILIAALAFGLLYYVFLGMLASKKNRSVIKWVGLSIIFSPIGHIVSYPLMLTVKTLPESE
jgi:hypothetical protein